MKVKDCMCNQVTCVTPESTVKDCAKLMCNKHVGCIPVCDNNNNVVGLVTDRDIILRSIACDKDTNQIANYAYIEWPDNIEISYDSPKDYFPKMISLFVPKDRIRELKLIHALPDEWYKLDYKEFLNQRRKLMAIVIKNGYETLTNKNFIEE